MVWLNNGYDGHWMVSREGFTQGHYLAVILYIIGMILLTLRLKSVEHTCLQPCYADDAVAGGYI